MKCFRTADAIGRLGGDEFVVLPSNSRGGAQTAVDRHTTIESLLAEADSNMYDDKVKRRAAAG